MVPWLQWLLRSFIHQNLSFTSVYTFGQPRTMTEETAKIFDAKAKSKFFRFQNNNDLVTRAPARLMGYSHVGMYIHITEDKKLYRDPGYWLSILDFINGALNNLFDLGMDSILDHDIEEYLAAVRKWDLVA